MTRRIITLTIIAAVLLGASTASARPPVAKAFAHRVDSGRCTPGTQSVCRVPGATCRISSESSPSALRNVTYRVTCTTGRGKASFDYAA